MRPMVMVHVLAGTIGLVSGFAALFVIKGMTAHRRLGTTFVYAMLTMCAFGFVLAFGNPRWVVINAPAATLTAYFVLTSLATVRPPATAARTLHVVPMVVALGVAAAMLTMGVQAVANGGSRNGVPAFPFFLFGVVGLIGGIGDLRVLRSGARRGTARLARHLWRMSFALFVAAMSFFIGQMKVMPKAMRIPGLLAIPPLLVLVVMGYWLWRVRGRRGRQLAELRGTPVLSS